MARRSTFKKSGMLSRHASVASHAPSVVHEIACHDVQTNRSLPVTSSAAALPMIVDATSAVAQRALEMVIV
jgi:hypothetical protein